MLHRAANNAHSWWCASHIRTRQSKWLDQNLKDMEEKVQNMLQMLSEDADSFSKKAEMYYRKRPEVIAFIEESFHRYRALAERYDHISGELQNAYHTMSSAFPDQVHFGSEEEEEEGTNPERKLSKIPKHVPDISKLSLNSSKTKKKTSAATKVAMNSSLSEEGAIGEVDKIQKRILVLQTEKEFMKSSYESALSKFWEIEKQIAEMQREVCNLQDEHGVGAVIEDGEARALMVATALKSCQDTLVQLQEQQKMSADMVRIEFERIISAEEKLRGLKLGAANVEDDDHSPETRVEGGISKDLVEDVDVLKKDRSIELESICEKLKHYFEMTQDNSSSITVVAEIVNELVNKVLTLGTAVSSQTALIERLKTETDELQQHLLALEEEKVGVAGDSTSLTEKLQAMEEELNGIQYLIISIKDQNKEIRDEFDEACRNLDGLAKKLNSPKMVDASDDIISSSIKENAETIIPSPDMEAIKHQEEGFIKPSSENVPNSPEITTIAVEEQAGAATASDTSLPVEEVLVHDKETLVEECPSKVDHKEIVDLIPPSNAASELDNRPVVVHQNTSDAIEDALWRKLLLHGLDNREKILLEEYTAILRNYKETKKRLSDVEKKNQESMFQTMAQVRELKSSNARKDLEIRSLKQEISILNMIADENSDAQLIEGRKSCHSRLSSQSDKAEGASIEEEIKVVLINEENNCPSVEEKFRRDIDETLEVNLEFWLRFSNSFHQIQKFRFAIDEIKSDISKTRDRKKLSGSISPSHPSPKSEVARINKNLRELQKQLSVWLEQSALHREELQCRLLSLSRIQDEIARFAEMDSDNDQTGFTAYDAEKFQGEVLNIQQENHTVHEELQAGVNYVRILHAEIDKILAKFNRKLSASSSRISLHLQLHQLQSLKNTMSKTRVPLRSFLFGAKPKKSTKRSIFPFGAPLNKQLCELKRSRKHSI